MFIKKFTTLSTVIKIYLNIIKLVTIKMVKIAILTREGDIIFKEIKEININDFLKEQAYNFNKQELEELYSLDFKDYQLKLFGSKNQFLLRENFHEFHSPLETTIFVGHLALLRICNKMNQIIDINYSNCQKILNIQN